VETSTQLTVNGRAKGTNTKLHDYFAAIVINFDPECTQVVPHVTPAHTCVQPSRIMTGYLHIRSMCTQNLRMISAPALRRQRPSPIRCDLAAIAEVAFVTACAFNTVFGIMMHLLAISR